MGGRMRSWKGRAKLGEMERERPVVGDTSRDDSDNDDDELVANDDESDDDESDDDENDDEALARSWARMVVDEMVSDEDETAMGDGGQLLEL